MQNNVLIKERFQLPENVRSARCSPFVISKVLAARIRKLIIARARKNKSTARLLANHYIFAIFFAVALHEKLGSLRNMSFNMAPALISFPSPFCLALSRVRESFPAFTLPLSSHGVAVMDER